MIFKITKYEIFNDLSYDYHYMDSYYVLSYVDRMPPKRMSTSEAPVLTHATIEKLVAHSVATVLEAQTAIMASTNNPKSKPRKTPVARKCAYKKITSYQLFYFNGTDGAVGLIRVGPYQQDLNEP
ncbi:hypothetical protein Tco_0296876 [Tanacetum coccineum]